MDLEWRRSPQLFRLSPAILHLATGQPGRDLVLLLYPPTSTLIASDTRKEPGRQLRTLLSRIQINRGVVDGPLGGLCGIQYLSTIKCTKPKKHSLIESKIQYCMHKQSKYSHTHEFADSTHISLATFFISIVHQQYKLSTNTSLHCRLT